MRIRHPDLMYLAQYATLGRYRECAKIQVVATNLLSPMCLHPHLLLDNRIPLVTLDVGNNRIRAKVDMKAMETSVSVPMYAQLPEIWSPEDWIESSTVRM